ncbi:ArsR family transcriptional regulator [Candidatus Woesearchaeota archaeon]|nr:ArsR family transcriptional regulator [Candidatus Woesearchaeota archaeon]
MERRSKDQIIKEIIKILEKGELSVNEIARKIKANWSTTNNALELLKGLEIVKEIITTPKIRIFRLIKKKG